jgi:S1-C subfamily serine protease
VGEAHSGSAETGQAFLVEASCGECRFGLSGDGCDLAVRIDGEAYYVDGSSTDDHGDAHASDGLCNAIRQAMVEGQVEEGRFVASSFVLLPYDGEPQPRKSRVGIALGRSAEGLTIDDVFADSPAEASGLRKGDVILELNDIEVAGIERTALQSIFTDNSEVRFAILRDGQPLQITVHLRAK